MNGQPMGSQLSTTAERQIDVRVEGEDAIQMVELIRNGQVIERYFPDDHATPVRFPGRAIGRIQYGWGPWAALGLGRTCLWDMSILMDGGHFVRATPCFQSAPYEESLRDKLQIVTAREMRIQSNTTRVQCYAEDPTKSVVCELDASQDATLTVKIRKPVEQVVRTTLANLIDDNVVTFTGPFTSESFILQRLVSPSEYGATIRWNDHRPKTGISDWYYVRVTQHNGQLAWIEKKGFPASKQIIRKSSCFSVCGSEPSMATKSDCQEPNSSPTQYCYGPWKNPGFSAVRPQPCQS